MPGSSVITIVSPAEALRVSVNDMSLPPANVPAACGTVSPLGITQAS